MLPGVNTWEPHKDELGNLEAGTVGNTSGGIHGAGAPFSVSVHKTEIGRRLHLKVQLRVLIMQTPTNDPVSFMCE